MTLLSKIYKVTTGTLDQSISFAAVDISVNLKSVNIRLNFPSAPFSPT